MPYETPRLPPVAVEVRPADTVASDHPRLHFPPRESGLDDSQFNPGLRTGVEAPAQRGHENIFGISNRAAGATYRLVYINGIMTDEGSAEAASRMVKRAFGVEQCETSLLYNPRENIAISGVKIFGGIASSRLGGKAEHECSQQLRLLLKNALETPTDRLVLVGHSQGSLIIQNSIDRLYDEYQRDSASQNKWMRESPRIEVILYAPLVSTLAPGPEAIGLCNSYDIPVRGISGTQRLIAGAKHYTGWREQQALRMVMYSPTRNTVGNMLTDPCLVHNSVDLILDSVDFNFEILAKQFGSNEARGEVLAQNLTRSIALGRRSDALHHELIIKGCDTFGRNFAIPFLRQLTVAPGIEGKNIKNFNIAGPRLERIHRAAGLAY